MALQFAVMLIELVFTHSEKINKNEPFHEHIINVLVRLAILFQNRYVQRLQILKLLKKFSYRYKSKIISCESFLKNLFEYIDIFRVSFLSISNR